MDRLDELLGIDPTPKPEQRPAAGEAVAPSVAAELTGVSKLTILKWIRKGILPAETIRHKNGNGYLVRVEDVLTTKHRPKAKGETTRAPVAGSVVAELQELRKALEAATNELHDLRGQLAATETRLRDEIQKALPAPERKGFLGLFKRRSDREE